MSDLFKMSLPLDLGMLSPSRTDLLSPVRTLPVLMLLLRLRSRLLMRFNCFPINDVEHEKPNRFDMNNATALSYYVVIHAPEC